MNQNIIRVAALIVIGLSMAIYVIAGVLTGSGNSVGQFAFYGMIGSLIFGAISPKRGVYLLIVLAAYSDLLKRLMVIEANITTLDITYVLGMAPLALAGAVLGVLFKKLLRVEFTKRDFLLFLIPSIFMLLGVAMGVLNDREGLRALRVVADYGAFSYLLFVLPNLFPTREEMVKLFKFALIVFVPVAIYGIWQRVFGLADFELAYFRTGLSTESRQLNDLVVRPFSTLNAATSLTMVAASSVMLSLICRRAQRMSWVVTALFVLLFATACFMTFTRVGWAVLVASLVMIPLLRFKIATVAVYLAAIIGFVGLIWQAELVRDRLADWQDEIYGETMSDDKAQALRVMTLSDRLIGFENMKRAENWTPFGIGDMKGKSLQGLGDAYSTVFSHDAFSRFLFRFGYVPSLFLVVAGSIAMARLHLAIFRFPLERQRQAQLGLAGLFGLILSMVTGNTVFQFPANIFLWFLIGWVLACIWDKDAVESVDDPGVIGSKSRF